MIMTFPNGFSNFLESRGLPHDPKGIVDRYFYVKYVTDQDALREVLGKIIGIQIFIEDGDWDRIRFITSLITHKENLVILFEKDYIIHDDTEDPYEEPYFKIFFECYEVFELKIF